MAKKKDTRNEEKALKPRPAETVIGPWDEMERWLEGFGRRGWLRPGFWEWPEVGSFAAFRSALPKVDVVEREMEIVVRAELPGVAKNDLDVTVSDDRVTLKAHSRHEEKNEEGEYHRREMSYGEYQRTIALPQTVDGEKAKATFTDGVLELTLPKLEKGQRKKVKVE